MYEQKLELFWQTYLKTLPKDHFHRLHSLPHSWSFGNCPQMADELGNLVLNGNKSATCQRYNGENILDNAGLSIILGGNKIPLCIIETYEITVQCYQDVNKEFAVAEGEGDLSLNYWQQVHWQFFSREAEETGIEMSEDMLLLCERFHVIYPILEI